jgi:hypothetical protein
MALRVLDMSLQRGEIRQVGGARQEDEDSGMGGFRIEASGET